MCNCGNKRSALQQESKLLSGTVSATQTKPYWDDVRFEYIGETGLSVTGSITGKRYRFNFKGDTQLIDYRDVNSLAGITKLKKLVSKNHRESL
jgi:hypothetical protein